MPEFSPIGYVRSRLTPQTREYDGTAQIVVEKRYEEALDGIEGFSHLIIIYHLHLVRGDLGNKIHPKNRRDLPLVGVFATHSQYRPNNIGLDFVELVRRQGNVLHVSGLDAFDGSPVLDIKPYAVPHIERMRQPEWISRLDEKV
jgi:tRNA-Thr(GGU) m(6)t(6)A37 methyltransferase TsaA